MERTETQKKILETSLDLFSRNGFKATTTREIANNAGVNEITLFRNFSSKENLLAESLDHGFDIEGLRGSVSMEVTGNLEKDIFSLLSSIRSNLRARERVYAIMYREIMNNDIVREKVSEMPGLMKGFLLDRLDSILNDRVRCDIDIETAGVFLASYLIRSEMMAMMMGADPFHEVDDRRLKEAISIFLNGVLKRGEN